MATEVPSGNPTSMDRRRLTQAHLGFFNTADRHIAIFVETVTIRGSTAFSTQKDSPAARTENGRS
ncbi:hypothetical protein GCM10011410_29400 [Hoyosella rhizosphaerae]|uniref:Uncharacterized protein n=1 Tax=Hoyosella rhizosphaerae TaxID=1755582 RepID=A0A916XHT7_9ACTN|nr:hypothetical protein GCM10011410_29400 [Hoyosella rhizosphaerae]